MEVEEEGASHWRRVQAGVGICSAPTREYVRYYRREETEKEATNVREVERDGGEGAKDRGREEERRRRRGGGLRLDIYAVRTRAS